MELDRRTRFRRSAHAQRAADRFLSDLLGEPQSVRPHRVEVVEGEDHPECGCTHAREPEIQVDDAEAMVGNAVVGGRRLVVDTTGAELHRGTSFDAALRFALAQRTRHTVILGDPLASGTFVVQEWGPRTSLPAPLAIELDATNIAALLVNGGDRVYFRANPTASTPADRLRWVHVPSIGEFLRLPAAHQTSQRADWIARIRAGAVRNPATSATFTAAELQALSTPVLRVLLAHNATASFRVGSLTHGGVVHGVTLPMLRLPLREPQIYLRVISMAEGKMESINAWDAGAGISPGPIQLNAIRGAVFRFLWRVWQEDRTAFETAFGPAPNWAMRETAGVPELCVPVAGTPTWLRGSGDQADVARNIRWFHSGDPSVARRDPAWRRQLAGRFLRLVAWPHLQELLEDVATWWLQPGLRQIDAAGYPALDPARPDRDTFVLKSMLMSTYVRYSGCVAPLLRELARWPTIAQKLANWRTAVDALTGPCNRTGTDEQRERHRILLDRLDRQQRDAGQVFTAIGALLGAAGTSTTTTVTPTTSTTTRTALGATARVAELFDAVNAGDESIVTDLGLRIVARPGEPAPQDVPEDAWLVTRALGEGRLADVARVRVLGSGEWELACAHGVRTTARPTNLRADRLLVARSAQAENTPTPAAPVAHAHHCVEISTYRSMDLTVDGTLSLPTASTATTPPVFALSAPTRFRTIAGLDTFPAEEEPTGTPNEFLETTRGRILLDTGHFRVDPSAATNFQVRLRGLLCHPADAAHPDRLPPGTGKFPVVVIVHGNHTALQVTLTDSGRPRRTRPRIVGGTTVTETLIPARAAVAHEVFSYRGYRDLQEHLARMGIVSLSIDTNAANELDSLVRFRADLVLEALDHLRSLSTTQGSTFCDRLDFSNVALVGHSRGGDAVTMAADLNRARTTNKYGMRAVVALAPTDFTGMLAPSARLRMTTGTTASFLCVYGSHDGDVSGRFGAQRSQGWGFVGTGFRHYDRATTQRAMVFVHGATHNRFNSVWIDPAAHAPGSPARALAGKQADNSTDAASVDPSLPPATAFPVPTGQRDARVLSAGAHRTLAREYVGGWLAYWLLRRWSEADRFTGARANSLGVPVALQWKLGRQLRSVDDFDDADPTRNVGGGAVTMPPFVRERLVELTDLPHSPHNDRALQVDPPTGAARVYRTTLPATARDLSSFTALTFRVSKHFPDVTSPAAIASAAFPPRFTVTLFDGTRRATVDAAAIAPLNPLTVRPYHRTLGAENLTKLHMQTWQVPLARFTGVTLSSVHAIELSFDAAAGEPIHLDTLSVVQS